MVHNSEKAEVQGEATARREQYGYKVHNMFNFDIKGSRWKEKAPQVHEYNTKNTYQTCKHLPAKCF